MNKDSKIYVAGHKGLVGSAILRKLTKEGYTNIIYRTSSEVDLINQEATNSFFEEEKPEYIFLAAAKVGGVAALDKYRADSIYGNLMIQLNVFNAAYVHKVKKMLFLGSNCLYPKLASQPLKEEYLLAGKLEPTTESYAIAKIAGLKMCEAYRKQYGCNFISALPVNLYGENDGYDAHKSHVMAALFSKFYQAKKEKLPSVEVWGSGNQQREFLHVDDLADACYFLMLNYNDESPINIGTGENVKIKILAEIIKDVSGYDGDLYFNTNMPEGIESKVLDLTKIHNLGWHHKINLKDGIKEIYSKYEKSKGE